MQPSDGGLDRLYIEGIQEYIAGLSYKVHCTVRKVSFG